MRLPVLLIVGDSITLGAAEMVGREVVRHVRRTYVSRLAEMLHGVRIVAEGGVHRTTTDGLVELPGLLQRHRPDVVLLMLGGNDAELEWKRFVLSDGAVIRHRVAVERYRENLEKMVEASRLAGAAPIITDFPRPSAKLRSDCIARLAGREIWTMIERGGGEAEWRRRGGLYADVATDVAIRTGAAAAWYAAALRESAEVYEEDGAHPNEMGHALIAEALGPQILAVLGQMGAVRGASPVALERVS